MPPQPKRKRGGQPGNKNSKGKKNAAGSHSGAPTGNKNAEKDGAYSAVFLDMLTDQEREIVEKTPLEVRAALEHEMKILKFREHKILEKIAEYEKAEEGAVYLSAMTEIRGKNDTTMRFSDSAFKRVQSLQEALYLVRRVVRFFHAGHVHAAGCPHPQNVQPRPERRAGATHPRQAGSGGHGERFAAGDAAQFGGNRKGHQDYVPEYPRQAPDAAPPQLHRCIASLFILQHLVRRVLRFFQVAHIHTSRAEIFDEMKKAVDEALEELSDYRTLLALAEGDDEEERD